MAPISFARGAPAPECLDQALIGDCARAALERDGITILSYGTGGGYGPLRELLARAPRRRAGPRVPDDRRPAGVRVLRRRAARAAAGSRARRGADLRPAAEDPRARRGGGRPARDGRRGPRPRRARGRAPQGRADLVPLHDPDVPEPVRPHDRHRAPPAARRDRRRARPPDPRGRPLRPRPLRRRAAALDPRARGRRAGHVHVVVLEDGRTRPPDRLLRRAAGARRRLRRSCRLDLHLPEPAARRRPCTSSCTAVPSSRTSIACAGC